MDGWGGKAEGRVRMIPVVTPVQSMVPLLAGSTIEVAASGDFAETAWFAAEGDTVLRERSGKPVCDDEDGSVAWQGLGHVIAELAYAASGAFCVAPPVNGSEGAEASEMGDEACLELADAGSVAEAARIGAADGVSTAAALLVSGERTGGLDAQSGPLTGISGRPALALFAGSHLQLSPPLRVGELGGAIGDGLADVESVGVDGGQGLAVFGRVGVLEAVEGDEPAIALRRAHKQPDITNANPPAVAAADAPDQLPLRAEGGQDRRGGAGSVREQDGVKVDGAVRQIGFGEGGAADVEAGRPNVLLSRVEGGPEQGSEVPMVGERVGKTDRIAVSAGFPSGGLALGRVSLLPETGEPRGVGFATEGPEPNVRSLTERPQAAVVPVTEIATDPRLGEAVERAFEPELAVGQRVERHETRAADVRAEQRIVSHSVTPVLVLTAQTAPDDPVTLTLSPDDLGHVRFEMHGRGEAIHVVLTVERPETLDMLRRHVDQLVSEFRQAGFSGASFSFSGAWGGGQERGGQPAYRAEPEQGDETPPLARRSQTGTGLDIRL